MWNFTEDGYLSIVEYAPHHPLPASRKVARKNLNSEERALGKGYKPATKNLVGSHLLVRARVEADLDGLLKYSPESKKFTDKSADYHYRVVVPRTVVAQYVADKVMKLDYDSHVKEVISSRAPQTESGTSRYSSLMKIWSATSDWQRNRPYSGFSSASRGYYGNGGKYDAGKTYDETRKAQPSKSYSGSSSYSSSSSYSGGGGKLGGRWENGKWVPAQPRTNAKWINGQTVDGKWVNGHWDDEVWDPTVSAWVIEPKADDKDDSKDDTTETGLVPADFGHTAPSVDDSDENPLEHATFDLDDQVVSKDDRDWLHGQMSVIEAEEETRDHNEYLATLLMDALAEDYGSVKLSEIPETDIAAAVRRVLGDEKVTVFHD